MMEEIAGVGSGDRLGDMTGLPDTRGRGQVEKDGVKCRGFLILEEVEKC